MVKPLHLSASRTYPVPLETAYDVVLPTPLPSIFSRRFAAIPAIKGVKDQAGSWGTVGQGRTIELADGGSMRETLTSEDRPSSFGYVISDITGPMKLLVGAAEGMWTFTHAGEGTRITWSWTVTPKGRVGAAAMPAFARMWNGYARQALEEIENILV